MLPEIQKTKDQIQTKPIMHALNEKLDEAFTAIEQNEIQPFSQSIALVKKDFCRI